MPSAVRSARTLVAVAAVVAAAARIWSGSSSSFACWPWQAARSRTASSGATTRRVVWRMWPASVGRPRLSNAQGTGAEGGGTVGSDGGAAGGPGGVEPGAIHAGGGAGGATASTWTSIPPTQPATTL